MEGLFNKKSELELLQRQYGKLKKEAYSLFFVDRAKSAMKSAEADAIASRLESLVIS